MKASSIHLPSALPAVLPAALVSGCGSASRALRPDDSAHGGSGVVRPGCVQPYQKHLYCNWLVEGLHGTEPREAESRRKFDVAIG